MQILILPNRSFAGEVWKAEGDRSEAWRRPKSTPTGSGRCRKPCHAVRVTEMLARGRLAASPNDGGRERGPDPSTGWSCWVTGVTAGGHRIVGTGAAVERQPTEYGPGNERRGDWSTKGQGECLSNKMRTGIGVERILLSLWILPRIHYHVESREEKTYSLVTPLNQWLNNYID